MLIFGGGLFGLVVFPASASATSLTLSIPAEPLAISITPTQDGTFNSANSKITVKTDAPFGYELKVKSASVDNSLTSSSGGGSAVLPSITSAISESTFKTDTTYNNKWGFKPSKLEGIANEDYQPVPDNNGLLIDKTTQATDLTTGTSYDITIGARVDTTLPAGQYSNTFIITASANDVSYNITYDLNDGLGGPVPNPQTGRTIEKTIALSATAPTRDKYAFLGWCTVDTTDDACSGETYQSSAEFPLTSEDNAITLHARWARIMQNWQDCSTLAEHETTKLYDIRDGNFYTVAKLRDGRCWMIENLRVGDEKLKDRILTPENTDITDGIFLVPDSSIEGYTSNMPDVAWMYINSADKNSSGNYYGGYYSWKAATAGTGTVETTEGDATGSICPKGWRLPTGNVGGEFEVLAKAYGSGTDEATSIALQAIPVPGFFMTGYLEDSVINRRDTTSAYWSSTVENADYAYHLVFEDDKLVYPTAFGGKNDGDPVRCISDLLSR